MSAWAARPLALADLPGLLAVQRACYGAQYVEGHAVFARRLQSPANLSQVITDAGGRVLAYLAAYRSLQGKVTPLHGDFDTVATPDTAYQHDMAVLPDCAGQGLGPALLAALPAQGLRYGALVAVQGAQRYWARHGYQPQALACPTQRLHLAGYGPEAVYMLRKNDSY